MTTENINGWTQIIIPDDEWDGCEYMTNSWEISVILKSWEHDYENKLHKIVYKEIK